MSGEMIEPEYEFSCADCADSAEIIDDLRLQLSQAEAAARINAETIAEQQREIERLTAALQNLREGIYLHNDHRVMMSEKENTSEFINRTLR